MRAALALAALALAGCGSGAASAPDAAKTPAELRVAWGGKVITLDPDQALDETSLAALHLIGGNLYELGPDQKLTPLLVESDERSGRRWTFTLRNGLRFSDGSPLTAQDVEATLRRAMTDEANAYAGLLEPIAAVEARSDTEVVFRLRRPYPSLPSVLAQPEMAILPSEGLERGKRFFDAPVSAGPYALESWGGGETAVLVRNDRYAGPKPLVETIVFDTIEDSNARLAQLRSGQIDVAHDVPPTLIDTVRAPLHAKMTPLFGFVTLPLNTARPPLDEVGVRRAIAEAVDRDQIDASVWKGEAEPLAGFWPATMRGHDDSIATARDVDGARAALRGTSCKDGCRLSLLYSTEDTWAEPTATIVAQNLKQVGIDVELVKAEDAVVIDRLLNQRFEIGLSFLYDYSDVPDGMLATGLGEGLNANFSGFRSPEVDAAIRRATTTTGAELDAALNNVEALFREHQPYATLLTLTVGSASRYPAELAAIDSGGFLQIGREG